MRKSAYDRDYLSLSRRRREAAAGFECVAAIRRAAENEARQEARNFRQRARRLRLRGFRDLADKLDVHATALQETAEAIAAELEAMLPARKDDNS